MEDPMPTNRRSHAKISQPIDVAQVLEEEYRALYEAGGNSATAMPRPDANSAPAPRSPCWSLIEDQLIATNDLVARLQGSSAVMHFFRERLAVQSRNLMTIHEVVAGLNHLLEGDTLLY